MRRFAVTLMLSPARRRRAGGLRRFLGASSTASSVTVSGAFGKAPAINIPAAEGRPSLTVKTLVHGTGPALAKTDAFVGNYAIYMWSGTVAPARAEQLQASTSRRCSPAQLLPGLEKALIGQKMGSRVLAVIPPKEAFGTCGNPQAGIKGTDTLVFVVDLIKNFARNASATGQQVSSGGGSLPKVTAATGRRPEDQDAVEQAADQAGDQGPGQGHRPGHRPSETVVVQYVGAHLAATGRCSTPPGSGSSRSASPSAASPSQVIPGWDKGLTGQTVGSRVMLVIPPADGYGKTGNSQAGIKGTDTLVFVVDILGAFS